MQHTDIKDHVRWSVNPLIMPHAKCWQTVLEFLILRVIVDCDIALGTQTKADMVEQTTFTSQSVHTHYNKSC